MKKTKLIFSAVLIISVLAGFACGLTACAGTPIERAAEAVKLPKITADTVSLEVPQPPQGYALEFVGADYGNVVYKGADGKICFYPVVSDVEVSLDFKLTETDTSEPAVYYFNKTVTVAASESMQVSVSGARNSKPQISPEIMEWQGAEGKFAPSGNQDMWVILDQTASSGTSNIGLSNAVQEEFVRDLKLLRGSTGSRIYYTTGTEDSAKSNDIFIKLVSAGKGYLDEGYKIEITDKIVIEAEKREGVIWAMKTLMQIMRSNEDNSVPKGIIRDYPKYAVRGLMLDASAKFYDLTYLRGLILQMSYYKLNDLQLKLSGKYFRLENKDSSTLTATDGSYTAAEFDALRTFAANNGVNLVPEISLPSGAEALVKAFPYLAQSGSSDTVDITKESVYTELNDFFGAYISGTGYSNTVLKNNNATTNIVGLGGGDCDPSLRVQYRTFMARLAASVKTPLWSLGGTGKIRMWSNFTKMYLTESERKEIESNHLSGKSLTDGIQLNVWDNEEGSAKQMFEEGYDIINTYKTDLFMSPGESVYGDKPDYKTLYSKWQPNSAGGYTLPAGSPQMLGASVAVFTDAAETTGISQYDVMERLASAIPAFAEKLWGDQTKSYGSIVKHSKSIGSAPNSQMLDNNIVTGANNVVFDYNFDNKNQNDNSGNAYHGSALRNAELASTGDGGYALRLRGSQSYISPNYNTVPNSIANKEFIRIAPGATLAFRIKQDAGADSASEQILLESSHAAIKANVNGSGKFGYTREGTDFVFDYTLPQNEWVSISIRTENQRVTLYVNDKKIGTAYGLLNKDAVTTLSMPAARIGSTADAFSGLIDDIKLTKGSALNSADNSGIWIAVGAAAAVVVAIAAGIVLKMTLDNKKRKVSLADKTGKK